VERKIRQRLRAGNEGEEGLQTWQLTKHIISSSQDPDARISVYNKPR